MERGIPGWALSDHTRSGSAVKTTELGYTIKGLLIILTNKSRIHVVLKTQKVPASMAPPQWPDPGKEDGIINRINYLMLFVHPRQSVFQFRSNETCDCHPPASSAMRPIKTLLAVALAGLVSASSADTGSSTPLDLTKRDEGSGVKNNLDWVRGQFPGIYWDEAADNCSDEELDTIFKASRNAIKITAASNESRFHTPGWNRYFTQSPKWEVVSSMTQSDMKSKEKGADTHVFFLGNMAFEIQDYLP